MDEEKGFHAAQRAPKHSVLRLATSVTMPRRIHNERARAEAAVHISNRAVLHAQSGRWRESADAYLEAWQATSRRDPRSYFYIHGYSSIFREEHLAITPADLAALRAAGEVEEMPCVDRVMALFSLGLLRWTAVDRQGAARAYRKCIAVAASATREDRMFRIVNATDPNEMMTAWEEIDDICVQANQNLRALEQKPPDPSLGHAHPGSSSTPMSRLVSLGNLGVEGNRELDELLSVGGGTCDFCDRAPSADGLKLRRCSRCLLAWYCISCSNSVLKAKGLLLVAREVANASLTLFDL